MHVIHIYYELCIVFLPFLHHLDCNSTHLHCMLMLVLLFRALYRVSKCISKMELAEEYHSASVITSRVYWAWGNTEYIFVSYYKNDFQSPLHCNNDDIGKDLVEMIFFFFFKEKIMVGARTVCFF